MLASVGDRLAIRNQIGFDLDFNCCHAAERTRHFRLYGIAAAIRAGASRPGQLRPNAPYINRRTSASSGASPSLHLHTGQFRRR